MALIKFHYPDEFIEELKKEPLAKPVVRLTNLRRQSEMVGIASLTVVATAKAADGDIIRLDHYSGSLWGHDSAEDQKTWEHAVAVGDQIRKACLELKLEVRAGIYEEEKRG